MKKLLLHLLMSAGAIALIVVCIGAFMFGGPIVGFGVTALMLLLAIALK